MKQIEPKYKEGDKVKLHHIKLGTYRNKRRYEDIIGKPATITTILNFVDGYMYEIVVDDSHYLVYEEELELDLNGTTEQLGMKIIDEFKDKMRKERLIVCDDDTELPDNVKILQNVDKLIEQSKNRMHKRFKKTKKATSVVHQRISWSEFFMGVAKLAAKRSRDPNTQVGACIVYDRRIISTGYNGMPHTCDECGLPLEREGNWLDTKYPYVVHAEMNAILNAPTTNLKKHEIYVTLFPCADCAKAILQAGITKVVYLEDKHPDDDTYVAAKKMFALSNIEVIKYEEDNNDSTSRQ